MHRYQEAPSQLTTGGSTGAPQCDTRGNAIAAGSARAAASITPGASVITNSPCDAIYLTADADVTVALASDSGTTVQFTGMKGGQIYPIACSKITAVSAGTVIALWLNKPS